MSADWLARRQAQSQREGDHRSPFQRDKARVLHSAAFRRLQAKTQVLGVGMNDFHRTRLTHSLEASQIGQGIAAQLGQKYPALADKLELNSTLIEALCLAHDIGHPPFGHGGEIALNYMMRNDGGFEGNGQTFRIVTKLEPYTEGYGMNLCRRTLLGLVKYPNLISALECRPALVESSVLRVSDWVPPKGLFADDLAVFEWLLSPLSRQERDAFCQFDARPGRHHKTRYKSFDCSVMELADDIAYSIHDLEDAIVTGIVRQDSFEQWVVKPIQALQLGWLSKQMSELATQLFSPHHYDRKDAIGALVNAFITAIEIQETSPVFTLSLLAYNAQLQSGYDQALEAFKAFVYNQVISKAEVQMLEYKGQQLVIALFGAFAAEPERLLPENTKRRWCIAQEQGQGKRVIADYIAGMTDDFASRLYGQLFLPKTGGLHTASGY
ncbi:anti-phage deoxyguanosine triphosphatase [Aliiglaciecola sp. CAU 1673]|uniref:anti-phage deoxyguanosine triphosphatase n=1 Tax=Aliiglaciecola sp. CAU 1673 TaxID=3032595 RepID=UPI0023DB9D1F|nr:anti-phage deoxyguanosine triphosphatase [Aliiglaciecola sp. CAU 1673]MDF2177670.1 anti-phage deoxyguanosine triphosphatase [Aliiglaciecola sp. CAU 1673]